MRVRSAPRRTLLLAAAVGLGLLSARDVDAGIGGGDAAELIIGGAVAGGLFAALGVGIGALVRNQVGAIIGALGWIFLVEPLLGIIPGASDTISRWFPSGAAAATAGGIDVVKMKPGAWLRMKSIRDAEAAM